MGFSRFGTARLAPLLLLAAWPLAAADTLTPFDVARIRTVGSIAISPDGSRIAYTLSVPRRVLDEEDGAPWEELHVVGKDGVSHPFVTGAVNVADIAWTKDGREISFVAKPRALEVKGSASELHWSPVGSLLALALAPTSLVDDSYMSRRVTIVDADSGRIAARIENPGKLGQIAWSPDGKNVAYVAAADVNDPSAGRLMAASASGGAARDLMPGYEGNVARIAWRDSGKVLFPGDEGVETVLGEVSQDQPGRAKRRAGGVSLVLYRYLKIQSKAPVRLVLYPGEGHGNRLAAHRLDYNLRAIQWMEHYLKGPGGEPPPYEIDYAKTGEQRVLSP